MAKCPSCGAEVPPESRFCLKCGHEFIGSKIPIAKTSSRSRLVRSLPWTLPAFVALLTFLVRPLFLTKGSETQNGVAVVIVVLGFFALVTGAIGFLIQLLRRKGKRVWVNIAFYSLVATFVGISIGDYVNAPSSDSLGSSAAIPSTTSPPTSGITSTTPSGGNVTLAQQIIPATGGTITVNKPGDRLNDLQLTVPAGAYKTATNFTVSYQNVKSANPDFAMAAPLISIENGGGFADQTMTLKVPVTYSGDEFPMLFYINTATGEMEGIPTVGMDATSITVGLNHFSNIAAMKAKPEFLQQQVKNGAIVTGFLPGQDDWSFENGGTYLSSNGNCAGMSLSSIWYFGYVSKGKTNRLYTQYQGDNKQIHEDDRDAWRLVSLVQQDFDSRWPSKEQMGTLAKLGSYANSKLQGDEVTYYSFLSAMSLSRQPQLVGMRGVDRETGERVGHAMIVYGVNSIGLMVADPNLPGNTKRVIPYTAGKLGPYFTNPATPILDHPNAGHKYEEFMFIGGGAILPLQTIAARNMEVIKNPTAISPFPDYKLTITDDQAKTYNLERDTFTIDKKNISLSIEPSGLNPVSLQISLFRDKSWIGVRQKKLNIQLNQGDNIIGIYVQSQMNDARNLAWSDFKWVTITYKPSSETWAAVLTGTAKPQGSTISVRFDVTVTFPQSLVSLLNQRQANSGWEAVMNASSSVVSQPPPPSQYRVANSPISNERMDTYIGYSSTRGYPYVYFKAKSGRYIAPIMMSYPGSQSSAPQIDTLWLDVQNMTGTLITGKWETSGNWGGLAQGTFTLTKK